ncbi:MAG TPA: hypothetical protein VNL16_05735 [Chloroflexota bacterium]|nr:hypothetical protein [Chloroflexota bacterium]
MITETIDEVDVTTLGNDDLREIVDQSARVYLGMDGETFLRLYRNGKLDDSSVSVAIVVSWARFGGLVD